jgi:hypothetical protein
MLVPLRYNQDHVANFNIDVRFTKDDSPTFFGMKPIADLGINAYYIMHSGSRYTKFEPGPMGLFAQVLPGHMESINASQMPWYHRLDVKIDKTIRLHQLSLKPYVWIYNLLNRKNVIDVYPQTGDPYDNGWFLTEDGKQWQEINGEKAIYYARKYLSGSGARNIGTARILRFGLLMEF